MFSIKQNFVSLNLSNKFLSVNIADDIQSPVLGNDEVQATLFLSLTDFLYVPTFRVSLLSVCQFTKHNNC